MAEGQSSDTSPSFTPEQEQHLRQIIRQELFDALIRAAYWIVETASNETANSVVDALANDPAYKRLKELKHKLYDMTQIFPPNPRLRL